MRGARQRRPLARRAAAPPWVASWAGRWALGAGGAVEVGEDPTETLTRELAEEWSVEPEREPVEALVCLPNRMVMLIGQAWLPPGAEVTPRRRARRARLVAARRRRLARRRPTRALRHMARLLDAVITFTRLKYLSFAHSAIYLTLLVLAVH